eukprot:gnl/TRDRNA2_/TRDRNA2_175772_c0_seq1.p1 gnl/TRDRNA2_/TRDRNA2_175772_c0~~gnl/TRDRNA2_/TRDRNA2_175772_c0_seq1.p1  ORF type:complete len:427 (+),score=40.08 gnl/TRDRNA2_/TRDRNA2_175772_c0_seq1:220-1500(+)
MSAQQFAYSDVEGTGWPAIATSIPPWPTALAGSEPSRGPQSAHAQVIHPAAGEVVRSHGDLAQPPEESRAGAIAGEQAPGTWMVSQTSIHQQNSPVDARSAPLQADGAAFRQQPFVGTNARPEGWVAGSATSQPMVHPHRSARQQVPMVSQSAHRVAGPLWPQRGMNPQLRVAATQQPVLPVDVAPRRTMPQQVIQRQQQQQVARDLELPARRPERGALSTLPHPQTQLQLGSDHSLSAPSRIAVSNPAAARPALGAQGSARSSNQGPSSSSHIAVSNPAAAIPARGPRSSASSNDHGQSTSSQSPVPHLGADLPASGSDIDGEDPWQHVTKVVIKNIPTRCQEGELTAAIDAAGFENEYYDLELPLKRGSKDKENLGYAFVRFYSVHTAKRFFRVMNGHRLANRVSTRMWRVIPARDQGEDDGHG